MEQNYIELPFDLETAKQHPEWAYTREGQKVRIICTDAELEGVDVKYPIVGLIYYECGCAVEWWTIDGKANHSNGDDLILLLPAPAKVKRYVITFIDGNGLHAVRNVIDNEADAKNIVERMKGLNAKYHEIISEEPIKIEKKEYRINIVRQWADDYSLVRCLGPFPTEENAVHRTQEGQGWQGTVEIEWERE